jgi:recombinational DNA repair protein RecR
MRKSIYDQQTGKTDGVSFRDSYVFTFYPHIRQNQADLLLQAAMSAWNEQLVNCKNCSTQCLNEAFELCSMFDRFEKTGWPT